MYLNANPRKSFLILLLILITFYGNCQNKAVFIIVDGIPADVIEKVETPYLKEIASKGGYTRAYQGGEKGSYNETPTISAPGYINLITGTWANKHNVWDNAIKDPNYSYWNIFRIAETAKPELKTAIFSTWLDNRTKLIGEGLPSAGNIKLDYAFDGFEKDTITFPHNKETYIFDIDEHVSKEAARYISAYGPDLSWVYLEYTDDMGHRYGDSPKFIEAVKNADKQIGRVWEAIKEREKKHGEKWMIVITTDHGRDAKNGKGHGGQSDRERATWIVTNHNKLNQRFKQNPAVTDILPSVLKHIKIEPVAKVKEELDGVHFIEEASISNLKAEKSENKINLSWNVLNGEGELEIFLSTTNNFKKGGEDQYKSIGKTKVSNGKYSFDLAGMNSDFYKIVVKAPYNWMNRWVVNK